MLALTLALLDGEMVQAVKRFIDTRPVLHLAPDVQRLFVSEKALNDRAQRLQVNSGGPLPRWVCGFYNFLISYL
jgi:hypothetical protein